MFLQIYTFLKLCQVLRINNSKNTICDHLICVLLTRINKNSNRFVKSISIPFFPRHRLFISSLNTNKIFFYPSTYFVIWLTCSCGIQKYMLYLTLSYPNYIKFFISCVSKNANILF